VQDSATAKVAPFSASWLTTTVSRFSLEVEKIEAASFLRTIASASSSTAGDPITRRSTSPMRAQ
jgi:hypothetical protein